MEHETPTGSPSTGSTGRPSPAGKAEWRRAIHIPSERGASRLVIEELLEQLGVHGWDSADIFSINLAAEEAIVNAIVHGNKLDPHKQVFVDCLVSAELVRVEIVDEGEGFNPSSVPDCTLEERLEVPSGRGVMLMRTFMTRIEYNDKGNRVLMEKRRG
ncbi:MAG: ATP-binding protein [Planctomycetota bacterium]|nr:MAG: ATP-binding protein [Planctomycetota bacterium]